jgi:hypothetical protein
VSTNTIDLGLARDIGSGENLYVVFSVDVAFAGGTSVDFQLITSAAANLGSPTVIATTGAIATATLVLGYQIALRIPPRPGAVQRYLGAQAVSLGTFTTGTITTRVVKDIDEVAYYASGYTVA